MSSLLLLELHTASLHKKMTLLLPLLSFHLASEMNVTYSPLALIDEGRFYMWSHPPSRGNKQRSHVTGWCNSSVNNPDERQVWLTNSMNQHCPLVVRL